MTVLFCQRWLGDIASAGSGLCIIQGTPRRGRRLTTGQPPATDKERFDLPEEEEMVCAPAEVRNATRDEMSPAIAPIVAAFKGL